MGKAAKPVAESNKVEALTKRPQSTRGLRCHRVIRPPENQINPRAANCAPQAGTKRKKHSLQHTAVHTPTKRKAAHKHSKKQWHKNQTY